MLLLRKTLNYIEKKRGIKKPTFILLVALKDILWFLSFYTPLNIYNLYQIVRQPIVFKIYTYFDRYQDGIDVYHKISLCITCMNRLDHLKKTLGKNIKNNADYLNLEFVLLDYNSNDGLQDWVLNNFRKELAEDRLVYYRTDEPKYFQMSRAKNISHTLASGNIVCNLDADNYTGKDFAFYINSVMQSSINIIGVHKKDNKIFPSHISDCGGRIFLTKENFLKMGGYNEKFIGWGLEDIEFTKRAAILGLRTEDIPRSFLGAITHNNCLREKNMNIPLKESHRNNLDILEKTHTDKNFHVKNNPIDFTSIKRIK